MPEQGDLSKKVVILGAGHAGGTAGLMLRQKGWTGPITILGEENWFPYQRPPLSKTFLKQHIDEDSLFLKPEHIYAEQHIEVKLKARVTAIDPKTALLRLEGGQEEIAYDYLILAQGVRAQTLNVPGADNARIISLRTLDDALSLKKNLMGKTSISVIGGGYLGLEIAASARSLGLGVTVIEREKRLLPRVASEHLAQAVKAYHEKQGVRFFLGQEVSSFETGKEGGLISHFFKGPSIGSDLVLIAIGGKPEETLAKQMGCLCQNGVVVDDAARTSVAKVYAIGDMTRRTLSLYNTSLRLESVANALEQAKQAVADLCGLAPPALEVPWFWSDQYDQKLQTAGLITGVARTIKRSAPMTQGFGLFHLDEHNHLQAVEVINAPNLFLAGRNWIASRKGLDPVRLSNVEIPIREI